jgi:hypothetical protein
MLKLMALADLSGLAGLLLMASGCAAVVDETAEAEPGTTEERLAASFAKPVSSNLGHAVIELEPTPATPQPAAPPLTPVDSGAESYIGQYEALWGCWWELEVQARECKASFMNDVAGFNDCIAIGTATYFGCVRWAQSLPVEAGW